MNIRRLATLDDIFKTFVYRPNLGGSYIFWKRDVGAKIKANTPAGHFSKSSGYWCVQFNGKRYLVHRIIWALCNGRFPEKHLDHIDGNPLNNLVSNLRECDDAENAQNRKTQANSSTGFTGVSWNKTNKKFVGYIKVRGARKHLGCFDKAEDAYAAYLDAKSRLHTFNPAPRKKEE